MPAGGWQKPSLAQRPDSQLPAGPVKQAHPHPKQDRRGMQLQLSTKCEQGLR
jgi:hypothetical protein